MIKRCIWLILVSLVLAPAAAGKTPEKRQADTLRDLSGVYFIIEPLRADVEADGLTTAQIQQDVELKLRHAGIYLMTETEWERTPGKPFLYIRVNTVKKEARYAYHLQVKLFQRVRLERYQAIPPVLVPTWSAREEIGVIDAGKIQEVRKYLAGTMEEFIKAYLALNSV